MADETNQSHPLEGLEGRTVTITPKDGSAPYEATVRSIHETGFTLWMDAKAKDDGEVRTVHVFDIKNGTQADASFAVNG